MSAKVSPLIDAEEAVKLLDAGHVVVIDATWFMPGASGPSAKERFVTEHVRGAAYFDIDAIAERASPLPHMLPAPAQFQEHVSRLGISNISHVLCYDANRFFASARAWWMLRAMGHTKVQVIDGGLDALKSAGAPLTCGNSQAPRGTFRAHLVRELIADMGEVERATSSRSARIVDARPRDRFYGHAPEPRPGIASGHMPGAISLPYSEIVSPDGHLARPDQLREKLPAASDRVITTCGSGVSAAVLALAYGVIGLDDIAVYDGSWIEWASAGGEISTR